MIESSLRVVLGVARVLARALPLPAPSSLRSMRCENRSAGRQPLQKHYLAVARPDINARHAYAGDS